jgi:hypothetical protein
MSTVSPNLSLPYIQQNQAQKHVTHNEGMRLLDGVVQLSVLSRAQTAPPANPVAGDRYILPSGATGAWAGFDDSLASIWDPKAWRLCLGFLRCQAVEQLFSKPFYIRFPWQCLNFLTRPTRAGLVPAGIAPGGAIIFVEGTGF